MVLIMFTLFLIGLTDVYVAGKFGKEIQAAYGVAFQIYFIFSIIAFALTVGAVSVISRLFTSGKKEEFRSAVGSSVIIAVVAGTAMSLISFVFSRPIIYSISIPEALKSSATRFMQVYSLGLAFSYILLTTNGILRGCRMIIRSLWTMAVVCVINIVLIIVLALHSPMGYQGIAFATVLSTVIGCFINFGFVLKLVPGALKFSRDISRHIIAIGWPAGMMQALWQLGAVVLLVILGGLPENNIEVMAAFTNGMRVEAAIVMPAFAFNMAAAVIVGNFLGKRENAQAFRSGLVTAGLGVGIVAVMSLVVILNAPFISGFLSRDPVVSRECVRYIYISFFAEPVMAWGIILGGALSGAGDTKGVMFISAASVWLARIPLCYLLGIYLGWGAAAVWWMLNFSIVVQAVFMTRRYFQKKWIKRAEALVLS